MPKTHLEEAAKRQELTPAHVDAKTHSISGATLPSQCEGQTADASCSGRRRRGAVARLGIDDHLGAVGGAAAAAQAGDAAVGHHVQLGRQQLRVAIEVQGLLDEEAELPRQLQAVVPCHLCDVQHNVLDLRLVNGRRRARGRGRTCRHRPGRPAEAAQQLLDVGREAVLVDLAHGGTHRDQGSRHALRIPDGQRNVKHIDARGDLRWKPADDAKVQEPHAAIFQDEEVACVQVGVEEIAPLDGERPNVQCSHQGRLGIGSVLADAFQVHHRHTTETLHGQDLLRRKLLVRLRRHSHRIQAIVDQEGAKDLEVVELGGEVQFAQHRDPQIRYDVRQRAPGVQVRVHEAQDAGGDVDEAQVGGEHVFDARLLDLDDNILAGEQGRGMHLGDGGRGQGHGVDVGEDL
mmetsp:Transcript_71943/g.233863  ORF Transcript_71943/g.233863 Transcript_71943/m.233863 type:complete len:404 (-) Transcript_71943:754-1965(-)